MDYVRPATHAGSWYSSNRAELRAQFSRFFRGASQLVREINENGDDVTKTIPGARILIAPHAGYTYSGKRLAESFNVWDTSKVKRVFILGPSHHVYFRGFARVTAYSEYETPLGNLPVDVELMDKFVQLNGKKTGKQVFRYMDETMDDDEHSFEMHAPYIYYKTENLPQGIPRIVPIMISSLDSTGVDDVVTELLPYLQDEENTFIISSDFCHWGLRFNYTNYVPHGPDEFKYKDVQRLLRGSVLRPHDNKIFKSIEILDKEAMKIASTGSSIAWTEYIGSTGNTICGQKPIEVVLKLLERYRKEKGHESSGPVFNWIAYSQSNKVLTVDDSSVSYASGYVRL